MQLSNWLRMGPITHFGSVLQTTLDLTRKEVDVKIPQRLI
jgi:hypothetical protein